MLFNYLKFSWRNFNRNRGYWLLNIGGLATGLACCLLITLFIFDELSFDRFHSQGDRIYRVTTEYTDTRSGEENHSASTVHALTSSIEEHVSGVEDIVRFYDSSPFGSFITQKRMKEIGIRKILGAKFRHIIGLLSRDFIALLAVSFAIAVPVTWYYMNQWLADFAYRIDFGPEILMAAAVISVLIIAISIGWHAVRATGVNPVAVIRKE